VKEIRVIILYTKNENPKFDLAEMGLFTATTVHYFT
jgi:hypothetical protein